MAAAIFPSCATVRPPGRVQAALHVVDRYMPEYVAEANRALEASGSPDKERLLGVGDRLTWAVEALDGWANPRHRDPNGEIREVLGEERVRMQDADRIRQDVQEALLANDMAGALAILEREARSYREWERLDQATQDVERVIKRREGTMGVLKAVAGPIGMFLGAFFKAGLE